MTPFEREVIERLTRIEARLDAEDRHKSRRWSAYLVILPVVVSAVVSWLSSTLSR